QQLAQHGDETVDGVRRLALRAGEIADGVESAEDIRVPVDQEQTGAGVGLGAGAGLGHGGDILCLLFTGTRLAPDPTRIVGAVTTRKGERIWGWGFCRGSSSG